MDCGTELLARGIHRQDAPGAGSIQEGPHIHSVLAEQQDRDLVSILATAFGQPILHSRRGNDDIGAAVGLTRGPITVINDGDPWILRKKGLDPGPKRWRRNF